MVPDLKFLLITKDEVKESPLASKKSVIDSSESNYRKPHIRRLVSEFINSHGNHKASTEKSKGTRRIAQER